PLVAHPVVVDAGIVTRLEAVDASAMMMDVDGASTLASAAHRRRAMQVPDPHAEAKFLFRERADRADVHDVAGILVVDRLAGIDVDAVMIAALENRELRGLGNLVEETR